MDLAKLKYYIIPNEACVSEQVKELQNEVYNFWRSVWEPTLKKMELPELDGNDFLRQKFITAVKLNDTVVAAHLYSIFDIKQFSTRKSKYFSSFSDELLEYCEAKDIRTLLTQEYLSVSPLVRKPNTGVSMPEVLMGMAVKITKDLCLDATGGTIRAGVPSVDRVSREISTESIGVEVVRYKMPHTFNIGHRDRLTLPDNFETKQLIQRLWDNKVNFSSDEFREIVKYKQNKVA